MKNDHPENGFTRREFLRSLSVGLGATAAFPAAVAASAGTALDWPLLPGIGPVQEDEQLGIALVGLGGYATGQLGPALRQTRLVKLAGIVTGTPAKVPQWRENFDIPEGNVYDYESFDRIADNDDIDIVYVVLPNSMHAEYVIRAARAGKHVICEKPIATNVADAEAMVAACRDAGKSFSVGYRMQFESNTNEIIRLARQRVYGPVEAISGRFGFNIGDPTQWRMNGELAGGGPLMDVGLYVIQASMYVHGGLPIAVTAREETNDRQRFQTVEESIFWDLEFPDGVIAHGESSYSSGGNYLRVTARHGEYALEPAYSYSGIRGTSTGGDILLPQVNQQALQMDWFAHHILHGAENRVSGEMGLRDQKVLAAIYESAATGQRIELNL